jgi:hypothetical protein
MEDYKKKIKDQIEELINKNNLKEAKVILKEYEELVKDDIDVYSFEGVISMMEGNYKEAEKILNIGNRIYKNSFDISYNLGYLYIVIGNNDLAKIFYTESLVNSNNENEENAAYNELLSLGVKDDKNEIVAQKYYKDAKNCEAIGNKSDAALYYGLVYKYSKDFNLKRKVCELYNDNKLLTNIFNVVSKSNKKRFIILSSCKWGTIYQRMHHISRALAKFENEVIYVEPTVLVNVDTNKINLERLVEKTYQNGTVLDGVKIYAPISAAYNENIIGNSYSFFVQALLDSSTDVDKTVIITYMPYQVKTINILKGKFLHIYDCVDDHSDLEYAFWGNKKDIVWEQELMDSADAITTTATSLYLERTAIERRKDVYLSRNAVLEGDFFVENEEEVIPEDIKNIPEPRIVYTGVVYNRYDEKLFYQVVDSNPDKSFIIIGPIIGNMLKEKRKNLYLLGPKKHSELKTYLKYMQIGIVPYIDTANMDIACDSIKQYEYIACGMPVITTYMPESAMNKIYTFLAKTKEDFNEAITKCLEIKIDKNIVDDFIIENSWNARAALLCNIADNNITDVEKDMYEKHIIDDIVKACMKYDSPIFETIKAMSLNLKDSREFEKRVKGAYNKFNNKYIEKQYLTVLLQNNKIDKLIEIAVNSPYIREEVRSELLFCKKINNLKAIECISYLCIGNLREALICLEKIEKTDVKLIYNVYIDYILGEKIILGKLNSIVNKEQESPLFRFLYKVLRMQETLMRL